MHTNHYFLRQWVPALGERLAGLVLAECFSQERDELVLGFARPEKLWRARRAVYLRALLRPDFVALSVPEEFRRAGRNSVDLFPELHERPVESVRLFENERAFALVFTGGYHLVFKLFGNRSNVILFEGEVPVDLFNSRLLADESLRLGTLDRPLDQTYAAFEQAGGDWRKLFPTFGREVAAWLDARGYPTQPLPERWALVQQALKYLEQPTFYLLRDEQGLPVLTLVPPPPDNGTPAERFTDPIAAANAFFYATTRLTTLDRERGDWLRLLDKRIRKTGAFLDASYAKLAALEEGVTHEELGHILMANLHAIPERAERVELYDFYRDAPITIKLKPDLSPQKNAEVYYRKAKNERIEVEHLQEAIMSRERDLDTLRAQRRAVEAAEHVKALRRYVKEQGLLRAEAAGGTELPFKRYTLGGFEVLVGRNAKNNDLLTQRYARKDDLWLHARDVPGSHVVIRHQAGKRFPAPVIEKAAQLAAYYSKRRTDSLCPVIVTPKKFVRKTRDLAEGQVIVEKEEVVLVVPDGNP
jgi:predicted ribosome quality control (RQC) complex YloA/Tae2 family protein